MRIFCCSNASGQRAGPPGQRCFNPPCGFFVVRTPRRGGSDRSCICWFQSAMRIFCCSNWGRPGRPNHDSAAVSIRHADFLLFEHLDRCDGRRSDMGFNPPCGFFVVRTASGNSATIRSTSFNPPCGFFVVRTGRPLRCPQPMRRVSIRHADFLLFERVSAITIDSRRWEFQSAMRIFCCSNPYPQTSWQGASGRFQSAMRIFCCSNLDSHNS